MCAPEIDRDPFRVLIGLLRSNKNSDQLLLAAEAAGLRFDPVLDEMDAGSHTNRIRVLVPRILVAYETLPAEQQLLAAQAAVRALRDAGFDLELLSQRLNVAGWELRDTGFVVRSPETREVFFPKGSQWDAFLDLRNRLARAQERIVVVDPYCDATIFDLLAQPLDELTLQLQILCLTRASAAVRGAADRFSAQYPGVTVEVRTTRDFHDRFVVLDGTTCIHVGASINRAGTTACMVSVLDDPPNRDALLAQILDSWNNATEVT